MRALVMRCLAALVVVAAGSCGDLPDTDLGEGNEPEIGRVEQAIVTEVCGGTSGFQPDAAWPMAGGCQTRATASSLLGPTIQPNPRSFDARGAVRAGPVVDSQNNIYLGNENKSVVKIDAQGGIREFRTGGAVRASAAIGASGTVYAGSLDKKLYALEQAGAAFRAKWTYLTGGTISSSPALDGAETIYVGSDDGALHAVLSNGQRKWMFTTGGPVRSSPALDSTSSTVVVGSEDRSLYAINATNGLQKWRSTFTSPVSGSPIVGRFGHVYVTVGAELVAVDLASGAVVWRFATRGCRATTLASAPNGVLYVGTDCTGVSSPQNALYAVDPSGAQHWSLATPVPIRTRPIVDRAGNIYFAADNGIVYAVDTSGNALWQVRLRAGAITEAIESSPALDKTGALVLGADKLYLLGPGRTGRGKGAACDKDWDCNPGLICGTRYGGTNVCAEPRCLNRIVDPLETEADCGGSCGTCPANACTTSCALGQPIPASPDEALDFQKGSFIRASTATFHPTPGRVETATWNYLRYEDHGDGNGRVALFEGADASVGRAADRLTFESTLVPSFMRDGLWQFDVYPLKSSAETPVGSQLVLLAWHGGAISLSKDASGGLLKYVSSAANSVQHIEWNRDTRLTLTLNTAARTIRVLGHTSGDAELAFDASTVATGRVAIGALLDGTASAFARISEPRKVALETEQCEPDRDCVRCGDGIATGSELCDAAADAQCSGDCRSRDGLTSCTTDQDCPLGQSCPSSPNGHGFEAGNWRTFCVPTFLCPEAPRDTLDQCDAQHETACGACDCTPQCDGKHCGDDAADGCGGVCTGFCGPREEGEPRLDSDCPPGYVVGVEGHRFGLRSKRVCWPEFCTDEDQRRTACGLTSSMCGTCDIDGCLLGPLCEGDKPANCPPGSRGNEIGVCVPTITTSPIDDVTTTAVGALPGSFDVSPVGEATYSVPIVVSPGRGGLAPSLSFEYRSASGNGPLGIGWSVAGLPMISVCTKTIAQDGILERGRDAFCIGGERLVPIAYVDGRTEFRTEFDSLTRYYAFGDYYSVPGEWDSPWVRPRVFFAQGKDGTLLQYGSTDTVETLTPAWTPEPHHATMLEDNPNSTYTQGRAWALTYFKDRAGNSVEILYMKSRKSQKVNYKERTDDATIRPRWIGYNFVGKAPRDAVNEIVFNYVGDNTTLPEQCRNVGWPLECVGETTSPECLDRGWLPPECAEFEFRPDTPSGFAFGAPNLQKHRLQSVDTFAHGKKVRSYRLTYEKSISPISLVESSPFSLLDSITECAPSVGGTEVCRSPTTFDYEGVDASLGDPIDAPLQTGGRPYGQLVALDWDNDGFDDIARYDGRAWNVHRGGVSGLESTASAAFFTPAETDEPGGEGYDVQDILVTDFDRNGKVDVLLKEGGGSSLRLVRFQHGSDPESINLSWPADYPRKNSSFLSFDYNGDGHDDLLSCTGDDKPWVVFRNIGGRFNPGEKVFLSNNTPSMRATGFCDEAVVVALQDGREIVVITNGKPGSTGSSDVKMLHYWPFEDRFEVGVIDSSGPRVADVKVMQAADVNGDGLLDLHFVDRNMRKDEHTISGWSEVWLNRGDGTFSSGGSYAIEMSKADPDFQLTWVDLNLDGRLELLRTGVRTWEERIGDGVPPSVYSNFKWWIGAPWEESPMLDHDEDAHPLLLDVNGDGRQDYFANGNLYWGKSPLGRLLNKVTVRTHANDVPIDVTIKYESGRTTRTYTKRCSDTTGHKGICMAKAPMPLVQSYERHVYKQTAGTPVVLETQGESFYYEDARFDGSRGFIGFARRTIDQVGINGIERSTTVEEYDLSPVVEPEGGPFFASDARLRGRGYAYYYYPRANIPNHVVTTWDVPRNPYTRAESMQGREDVMRSITVQNSDASLRFVAVTAEDERVFERDTLIDWVHSERSFDQYTNLKTTKTEWPLEEKDLWESAAFTYDYEDTPVRVANWQVDLVSQVVTTSSAPVSGPGHLVSSQTDYAYTPGGLLQTTTVGPETPSDWHLVTTYGRDGRGNVDHVEQQAVNGQLRTAARIWDLDYDALARVYLVEMQNPMGHPSRFSTSYADGITRSVTDANNVVTTWKYDGFGRVVEESPSGGVLTRTTYEPSTFDGSQLLHSNGAIKRTRRVHPGADELVFVEQVDTSGRLVATQRAGFAAQSLLLQEYAYDRYGRLEKASRPHLRGDSSQGVITFGYDSLGRGIREQAADDSVTQTYYASTASILGPETQRADARWFTITEDAKHRSFKEITNARGATIQTIDPVTKMDFKFGAGSFLLSATDSVGNVTKYEPDGLGRLKKLTDPDTGVHEYTYTPFGEVLNAGQNGQWHIYQYDALGRPIDDESADGHATWTWDQATVDGRTVTRYGELIRSVSPQGVVDTFAYEGPRGAPSSTKRRVSGVGGAIEATASFTYDNFLRPKTVQYPGTSGFAVEYQYNRSGFLDKAKRLNSNEVFWSLEETYSGYLPQKVRLGNGTIDRTSYHEARGWITNRRTEGPVGGSPAFLDVTTDHDENGNVDAVFRNTEELANQATWYEYDDLDRLEFVKKGSLLNKTTVASYTYSPTGNINTKTGMGAYTYGLPDEPDTGPQTLPHFVRTATAPQGAYKYEPDAFGRVERRSGPTVPGGVQTFNYDASGQLNRVDTGQGGPRPTWQEYGYSADGQRALVTTSDGMQTLRLSNLYERVIPAQGDSKEIFRVLVGGQTVAEVTHSSSGTQSIDYLHRNQLGSVEVITAADGSVSDRRSYDAFGATGDVASGEPAAGFTGHRQDVAIGLIDMNARFYDAELGRFLTPDPTIPNPKFSQAYNRYSYVYNNPMSLVDPTGLRPDKRPEGGGGTTVVGSEGGCGDSCHGPRATPYGARQMWDRNKDHRERRQRRMKNTIKKVATLGQAGRKHGGGSDVMPTPAAAGGGNNAAAAPLSSSMSDAELFQRQMAYLDAVNAQINSQPAFGYEAQRFFQEQAELARNKMQVLDIEGYSNPLNIIDYATTWIGEKLFTHYANFTVGDQMNGMMMSSLGGPRVSRVAARGAPTRFVDGARVVDRRSGAVLNGTTDLKPTLDRIRSGGTFPHRNDGSIFQNRPPPGSTTPLLPAKPAGYYREYVHPTPGVSGPGPQRVVVGQGGEMYYTPDHYGTFIPLD